MVSPRHDSFNNNSAVLPRGFDPAACPILAVHHFGVSLETVRRVCLGRCAKVSPTTVAQLGGRHVPEPPLMVVPS